MFKETFGGKDQTERRNTMARTLAANEREHFPENEFDLIDAKDGNSDAQVGDSEEKKASFFSELREGFVRILTNPLQKFSLRPISQN